MALKNHCDLCDNVTLNQNNFIGKDLCNRCLGFFKELYEEVVVSGKLTVFDLGTRNVRTTFEFFKKEASDGK